MTMTDDATPATKGDLKDLGMTQKADIKLLEKTMKGDLKDLEQRMMRYFDIVAERMHHDIFGGLSDKIELVSDRVTRIERRWKII